MRILHTGDWHLGRIFYARHLTDDQAYVLEHQLLQLLKEARIDVLVIAGDVYDRAVPPVDAVALWDMILTKVALELGISVLVIGGNHDSAERLAVNKALLAPMGVHIWGQMGLSLEPLVLTDETGPFYFCPFPFTEPRSVKQELENLQAQIGRRIIDDDVVTEYGATYAAWSTYMQTLVPKGARSIAIAHAMVAGSETSASERPLLIGGSSNVGIDVFTPFTYTALGHIHRPQQMGLPTIRYSGSLLKYSFDEAQHKKSFTIVDIAADGSVEIETIPIEPLHDVVVLEGLFDEFLLDADLQSRHRDDYVLFRLTDKAPVLDGMARLRAAYPMAMSLELVGRLVKEHDALGEVQFKKLSERELFEQFTESVRDSKLNDAERTYINSLWERILKEDKG
ncbi:exonuclease SbcCD subunit D [uncultured Veillonella sp.]|uniref:exonuclease SbcCD subunit D n=1 Tax=uncultured Veillonella sp. TaxID=159268 RepID=UPI00262268A6|nr:exonuclease SbcCD subunit D [uncultured Veillonella sp.]